jgi:hypothetical protein
MVARRTEGGNAAKDFQLTSSGRIAAKTSSPGWWGRTLSCGASTTVALFSSDISNLLFRNVFRTLIKMKSQASIATGRRYRSIPSYQSRCGPLDSCARPQHLSYRTAFRRSSNWACLSVIGYANRIGSFREHLLLGNGDGIPKRLLGARETGFRRRYRS